MWSDPIDNALANVLALMDISSPTADQIERAKRSLIRAREIRAKEDEHGRLVTPEDRW